MKRYYLGLFSLAVLAVGGAGCSRKSEAGQNLPPRFEPVKPLRRDITPAANLSLGKGRYFSYAMPPGWGVGEDGQYALTLVAPDTKALTVMVGNSGLPVGFAPARFVSERLAALRPQNVQMGAPKVGKAGAGFAQATLFEVSYSVRGVPWRGLVKCQVAPAYDSQTMAMTAALSEVSQWEGYSTWLPQVAEQIAASDGGAFGMRGLMAQNLQNSTAYADAAKQYRDWSQKNWQRVTADRNASEDRKNFYVRENLGGVQTYNNPYGNTPSVELPVGHNHFWIDRAGNVVGTDDPSANPNVGSTVEWRKMERAKP